MTNIENENTENPDDENDEKSLDPVAEYILSELAVLKEGEVMSPEDMAKVVADMRRKPKDGPQLWRKYMHAVKQQTIFLARSGKVDIMRKGQVADPNDFKGLWKMRLHQD